MSAKIIQLADKRSSGDASTRRVADATASNRAKKPAARIAGSIHGYDVHHGSNLTMNQVYVWMGQSLLPEVPIYNLATALNIHGALDLDRFRQAFQVLVNSSDALRTVVVEADGFPMQRTLPSLPYSMEIVDVSSVPDPDGRAKSWMHEHCRIPLKWQERLFGSALIKLAEREFIWYLNIHHLIGDGWSFELIYRHMAELYQQSLSGRMPAKVNLYGYADYVAYERLFRESSRHERAEAYWKKKLSDVPNIPNFCATGALSATTRVRRMTRELDPDQTRRFKAAAGSTAQATKHESLFEAFAAILVAYLHCIDGKESYTIGVPFHNRRSKAFKETIGFFSEVLPVTIAVADDDTFSSLVAKVRREIRQTARHGQYSVANPYFKRVYNVVLNYHTGSFMEFAGMPAVPQWIHNGHGDEALAIQVRDFNSSMRLALDFDLHEGVFGLQDSERTVNCFLRVVEEFISNPDQPLRGLNLLSAEETRRVLVEWSHTANECVEAQYAHELFEAQVERTPDADALINEHGRLSYRELNEQANRVAHYLQRRGVGPETRVGLYIERSPEMIVGLLAILKTGAAYVPIDPSYPAEWLNFILEDTGALLVLSQQKLSRGSLRNGTEWVSLDASPDIFAEESAENPMLRSAGDGLAYVIYTSGSTGEPKGVEIPHRALVNFAAQAAEIFALGSGDRVLQLASISFDTSVEEIFPCLIRGAALVLRTESMMDSPSSFLEKCRDWGITVLDLPTAYWHELTVRLFSDRLVIPESVRLIIIGGERAIPEKLVLWHACVSEKVRLLNTYGPTEATVAATVCELTHCHAESSSIGELPIGRPIPNVQTYVLDRNLKPVPVGVPGELYIGGAGLGRGYVNRPDLTEERFISNPFGSDPQDRLYRSGDLVRYRGDGNLEFVGRIDHQVKVRGFRVELEGIETVLRKHPLIQDAVVAQNNHSLVAYVVPQRSAVLNTDEVKYFAASRMPEYMVPATIVVLESLPLTLQGKVDRRALPDPDQDRAGRRRDPAPPQGPVESRIAEMWREILNLSDVGRNDHFFELGGQSLLAIQLVSRIQKEFQVTLPLREVFEGPTVAQLADCIEKALRANESDLAGEEIQAAPRNEVAPVSDSQLRIWYMHQLAPTSAAYNIAAPIRFTGALHKDALKRSLEEMTRRHESLRTTFRNDDGKPVQIVAPRVDLNMPEVDLRSVPEERREGEAKRILAEKAQRPFDVENGSLMRLLLLRLADEEHILLLNMHHLISDQWSLGVVSREMTSLYNAFCGASTPTMLTAPAQYADFATWQAARLTPERLESQLAYWKMQLADVQPVEIPTDFPRPSVQTFHGAYQSLQLSKSMMERIKSIALADNSTLYMVFLATFKVLLRRYTGQSDVIVGSPVANRSQAEWEGVVGTFINILALRTDLSGSPTFRDVLRRVRKVVLEAVAHQDLPFEKLVEELRLKHDPSRSPLFQILFNFQSTPKQNTDLLGLSWMPFEIDQCAAQFDISVSIDPEITQKIFIAYNTDLYRTETIARMLEHYHRLLEAVAARADQSITRMQMLGERERSEVLTAWNDTALAYPHSCVHELFEEQARQRPESVALTFKEKKITYAELNQRANRVAKRLRALGVKPETPVGICVERSAELVIGLLGILKAGGAYVPIDPAYPSDRVSFMLEDSGAPVLLTQQGLLKQLPHAGQSIVCLDTLSGGASSEEDADPKPVAQPHNRAYVIYTSGSTGRPKGVEIEHRALVNFLHAMRHKPGISPRDVLLSVTTVSFDIAALEIFLPLTVGASVVLASRETAADGRLLIESLDKTGATMMQATPATWRMLIDLGWKGSKELKILCGGESLPPHLAKALLDKGGSVWNLYGPTETTIWSTLWLVEAGTGVSIGKPIHNTQVYVLDGSLEPVPSGIPGELYIGGDGVARGYLNHPELTAEKFVPDPFRRDPGARLFKTGDLVRYRPDGSLEWLERIDHQVKIRGHRIELGEIEGMLERNDCIKQAVVVARDTASGEQRLTAYIVGQNGHAVSPVDLRDRLGEKLPAYMIPQDFVFVDALPMTPNGKVNRRALPPLETKGSLRSESFVAARDDLESAISRIWERVLGVRPIGVKDNFFDIGGHSLTAVRLIAQIQKSFGKQIPLAAFFSAPTVEALAKIVGDKAAAPQRTSVVSLQPHGSRPPLFWVHGDGSNYLLPNYLGPDQPMYGLVHQSQDGHPARYTSVETIAEHYLEEIRDVQPAGPYFLGGFSFGGLVAFEMAQQLQKKGEPVALLALLDPTRPGSGVPGSGQAAKPSILQRAAASWSWVSRHRNRIAPLRPLEKWAYVTDRLSEAFKAQARKLARMMSRATKRAGYKLYLKANRTIPLCLREIYIMDIYLQAARNYFTRPYLDHVTIFCGEDWSDDLRNRWRELARHEVEFHDVQGRHTDLVSEPHAQSWVARLKVCLEKAQKKSC